MFTHSATKVVGVAATFAAVAAIASPSFVHASGGEAHPVDLPFTNKKLFSSFDYASVRRGFEVYRQICSSCHSLNHLSFRNLVGATHTEAQAKLIAQQYEVEDGPNSEGEMFARPGILSDKYPAPFANEEAARYANGGANPPDLSLMAKARHAGQDYIFNLLLGYRPCPPGVTLRSGLHYNPYFPGGAIAMAPPLVEGVVEYEDGTPATIPQMAKDISTFLTWTASPELDARKYTGLVYTTSCLTAFFLTGYWKLFRWGPLKNRKISYIH